MSEPKRQHSVPEMLQQRFADACGLLWFFDKQRPELGVRATSPNNLFVRHRQYTLMHDDGTRTWDLEERYSKMEGYMHVLVEQIVPRVLKGRYPLLPPTSRRLLDLFVYEQWRRVPEVYDQLMSEDEFSSLLRLTMDEYERLHQPLADVEREKFASKEYRKAERKRARVISLSRTNGSILKMLSAKGLFFARTPRKRSFLLGSAPVVKLNPPGPGKLSDPQVEVWLAIDPSVAVVLAGNDADGHIVEMSDQGIRKINQIIARQCEIFAGRDEALVAAIATDIRRATDDLPVF
jgi:hypothetical protein